MTGDLLDPRRCKAMSKRSGAQCKRPAIVGGTVCATHGGSAPQVRAAAEERLLEQKAAAALASMLWNPDAEPVTDSVSEMRRLAGALGQAVNVLGRRMNDVEVCEECGRGPVELDGATAATWMRGIREQRQLLAEMKRLGLEERKVEVEQAQALVVTSAFRAALAVVALLPADRDLMVRTFLRTIGVDPEALEAAGGAA